ncbi:SDR family oxidoreductase [Mycobacterium montefiorense]|uniref:Short-chain dehydrogenase n=1 Tax=Mycobacterium montefiorense TaxID=154654 RepID=A0AA37UX61_9MYCO|nr:SDR family oxidoreductase [Mycobacterium montefiorense]GBG37780.1 short-chain dehydrogenase [Mycobacterium montefiorense]GKU34918.1 short-chain dehydrogenase [Mycobacterium montefiorense]GKU40931.1 short-chain dehydrogenase [Mycobacterium montefiorense]GKU47040.1 short-chain dehydrogenase [Mycobacterium montefiorense]GKU49160.1 short-chain dehydrogenase [Mycobacterium montefiorense]
MVNIKGSTVLVTGGQRGLGKAIVDELLRRDAAKVYATARAPKPSEDPRVVSVALEVTNADSVAALAVMAADTNIVINNAGTSGALNLLDSDIEEIHAVFETNYFGALRVGKAFAPVLAHNGGGALVNIHSVASWLGGMGGYGDSKAAIWAASNSLRIELETQSTLVTGVHVGYLDTEMFAHIDATKNDRRQIAREIVDGIERGDTEVLADEVSRHVKSVLSGPVEALQMR